MTSYLARTASMVMLVIFAVRGGNTVAAAPEASGLTEREAKMFSMSAGYETFMGRWSRRLAPAYIEFASVKNGDRILDVGTGTGALASALEASMTSSEVKGIDPSEGFIAYAKKNAKSARVAFEVGDGQALQFKDGSFDQTMALLVMNFIPDHEKAIGEMRRAELWTMAGLVNVQERPLVIDQDFASFEDYWQPFLKGAGPGGAYVVSLPAEQRQQLEARMRKRLLGDREDGAFKLKARAWCVRGEVPKI